MVEVDYVSLSVGLVYRGAFVCWFLSYFVLRFRCTLGQLYVRYVFARRHGWFMDLLIELESSRYEEWAVS